MIKCSWNEGDIEDISIYYSVYYDCLVCANCSMSHSRTTVTFKNKLKALEHLREHIEILEKRIKEETGK